MAASPAFKVYDSKGNYQAACKEPEAAASLVGNIYGVNSTVRFHHNYIVWTEGFEFINASDSYDQAAEVIWQRSRMSPALAGR